MTLANPSSLLLADVRQLINGARQRVASAVNAELTQLYWHIGNRINVELLKGERAVYGKQVVRELAQQLTAEFGKGWSERQLRYCLRVADTFPDEQILHTLCSQLSWSHLRLADYLTLLPPRETLQAKFHQSIELARQKLLNDGNPCMHTRCVEKYMKSASSPRAASVSSY